MSEVREVREVRGERGCDDDDDGRVEVAAAFASQRAAARITITTTSR